MSQAHVYVGIEHRRIGEASEERKDCISGGTAHAQSRGKRLESGSQEVRRQGPRFLFTSAGVLFKGRAARVWLHSVGGVDV